MNKSLNYLKTHFVRDKVCNQCGSLVLTSDLDEYQYQCLSCDEDLYYFEVSDLVVDGLFLVEETILLYENIIDLLCLDIEL